MPLLWHATTQINKTLRTFCHSKNYTCPPFSRLSKQLPLHTPLNALQPFLSMPLPPVSYRPPPRYSGFLIPTVPLVPDSISSSPSPHTSFFLSSSLPPPKEPLLWHEWEVAGRKEVVGGNSGKGFCYWNKGGGPALSTLTERWWFPTSYGRRVVAVAHA